MKSLIITGVTDIYLVVNDNQMYALQGEQGVLFINISDSSYSLIEFRSKLGFAEFQKIVNEYEKTYYWAYSIQVNNMYEYAFDLKNKKVIETGFYFFKTESYLSIYVQNLKSTTQMSTYHNDDFDKVLSSYVQKYKRYKITSRVYEQSLYSDKFGKLFVISDNKLVSFDIYTGSQEILFTSDANLFQVQMNLFDESLICFSKSESENNFITLINLSTNEKFIKKLEYGIENIFYSKDDNLIFMIALHLNIKFHAYLLFRSLEFKNLHH
ncbi:hypothetical protein TTHERM_000813087 (macronuclear) [Tetrahymena thermophila SB210]|uniref:Uncharacterized protein n=1 Tax=Tetrahymena thermophila (strain SB210) TaxID=312017 RepID=W7XER4_TETTS|nr:hypothetical protein TTHERM_000813087 [Tetrahymena thermophila SB210]EWS76262.1 hypothetical protein TTHERM_000813087 [Tetrahymena thermophila SB210]|eukprot:XP_012651221.1 hypothetical protein TTHERM_000813087 [Tetrahymena thermophila SB210]